VRRRHGFTNPHQQRYLGVQLAGNDGDGVDSRDRRASRSHLRGRTTRTLPPFEAFAPIPSETPSGDSPVNERQAQRPGALPQRTRNRPDRLSLLAIRERTLTGRQIVVDEAVASLHASSGSCRWLLQGITPFSRQHVDKRLQPIRVRQQLAAAGLGRSFRWKRGEGRNSMALSQAIQSASDFPVHLS